MTNELSLLTALSSAHVDYLAHTWNSISSQDVPVGWEVHWYIQEDGPASTARSFVDSLNSPFVHYASSDHAGGPAEARNLALTRAQGDVVMVLDADDTLTPGAISRTISLLDESNLWCGFAALDDRNGQLAQRDTGYSRRLGSASSPEPRYAPFVPEDWLGHSERGDIRRCWELCGYLPFHPATFATFARFIWDVGGWPALGRDEDTAVILAISDRHHGHVSHEPNVVYRHHDHQTSRLVPPIDERLAFIERRLPR